MSHCVSSNVSRAGLFGTIASLLALAKTIGEAGWSESSTIMVSDDKGPMASTWQTLAAMLEPLKDTQKVAIGDHETTVGVLKAEVAKRIASDDRQVPVVVSGNRRALAVALLDAMGIRVKATTKVTKQAAIVTNVTENMGHLYIDKLDRKQVLASAAALRNAKLVDEAGKGLAKHGFNRASCILVQSIWSLEARGYDKERLLASDRPALQALASALKAGKQEEATKAEMKLAAVTADGKYAKPNGQTAKTVPGKDLLVEAARLPEGDMLRRLLEAIATGQALTVTAIVTEWSRLDLDDDETAETDEPTK